MSLTIRSASPKTHEVLPHRSTLVQALSQPPQRVSTHCSQESHNLIHVVEKISDMSRLNELHLLRKAFLCLLDAEPSVITVWW